MKKNVFQGFNEIEAKQLESVKGGYFYQTTGGTATDEECVTEKGEYDPWSGEDQNYQCVDQKWDNCRP